MATAPIVVRAVPITSKALLVPLLEVVGFGVALGLIYVNDYFTRALFGAAEGVVAHIPWLGRKASSGLHAIEKRLSHAMGAAAEPLERRMGAALTTLGHTVAAVAEEIFAVAVVIGYLQWMITVRWPLGFLFHQVERLHGVGKVTVSKTTVVIRRVRVIEKQVAGAATGRLGAAIQTVVRPLRARIGSLERLVGRHGKVLAAAGAIAIPVGWGALRGRTRNLEDALAGVRRRLRALERKGVGAVAVAGVVAVLAKIGASFIRCTNVKRTGRHLCGMDAGLLDALLLGTYAIVGGVSIVELARGMQGITDESTDLIRGFVRETSRGST